MDRINKAIQAGEISPDDGDILKRMMRDCQIAADGFDIGKEEGMRKGLRIAASQAEVQADLCDRGITPSADLLRILAATWRAQAAALEDDDAE